jgi:4-hydroxy-4-methyl-2-oxoglutarate aldolase
MSTSVLDDLAKAYSAVVADALDRMSLREQVLDPAIRPLRPEHRVVGRAVPVVIQATSRMPEEPYAGEMNAVESLRPGDVPVIVVDPASRAAAWGELFSCAAIGRGALGVVVDGCVRDARQTAGLGFPVFCRGFSPLDTLGRAEVATFGERATCGGVTIEPGDYVVADEDGVVIVPSDAVGEVAAAVREKIRDEGSARADLLAGAGIREVWDRYGVF